MERRILRIVTRTSSQTLGDALRLRNSEGVRVGLGRFCRSNSEPSYAMSKHGRSSRRRCSLQKEDGSRASD
jgi:hypothetical protein